jgi:hypothetical protein
MADYLALSDSDAVRLGKLLGDYDAGRLTALQPGRSQSKPPLETYFGKIVFVGGSGSGSGSGATGLVSGQTGLAEVWSIDGTDESFTVSVYNATSITLTNGLAVGLVRDPFTGTYLPLPFSSFPNDTFVSNVCPATSGGGITVEYTHTNGTRTCVHNPSNCCGSGSGSGSGDGSCDGNGGVSFSGAGCCAGQCIPKTLHLTISGACTQLNGTYTISLPVGGPAAWESTALTYNGRPIQIQFACFGPTVPSSSWGLQIVYTDDNTALFFDGSPTTNNCNPLHVAGSSALGSDPAIYGPCHGDTIVWSVTT